MIVVKLLGGIGNQMFEYAFGRYLAIKNKTELKLDLNSLGKSDGGTVRQFELSVFNIHAEPATAAEIKKIKWELPGRRLKIMTRLLKKRGVLPRKNYIHEFYFRPDELIAMGDNVYLEGFFQNEKYFQPIADIIRTDFTLRPELNNFNPELVEKIKNCNSVSLHVRRGDYATDAATQKWHGLLPLEYYQKSLKFIMEKIVNPRYFVFSDDLDWCRANLKMPTETTFISGKNYEDLILMSLCKHQIIANSSFSWWGAWLNDNLKKIIIAPKQWLADEKGNEQIKNLIPPDWIRI
jgi:Glycosyl transferase family 11.